MCKFSLNYLNNFAKMFYFYRKFQNFRKQKFLIYFEFYRLLVLQ